MTDQAIDSVDGSPAGVRPVPPLTEPCPDARGLRRPAQLLLGWLPPERGEFFLADQAGTGLSGSQRARVRNARDAVSARPAGIDQAGLISAVPAVLADHITRVGLTPAGTGMRAEGWDIAMVELGGVVAFQPSVFTDTATERVASLDPGDLRAIAELTLPVNHTAPVSVQYDELKHAYTITSPNPNLRVAGNVGGPQSDGSLSFGFTIAVGASFVQVARFQGRLILRDGYHRSFGLLGRGITQVPAYIRNFDTTENLAPAGMLPQSAWLGDCPPLLRDYHDSRVAEPVNLPAQHRMIVIHALELLALS
jgi:hypothetical protein